MIRSNDKRITVIDRLNFLWALCLIAHLKEHGQKVSWYNIEQMFGKQLNQKFNFYREMAMEYGYVAPDSHTLTPKALKVVANWRAIRDRLMNIQ